MKTIKVKSAEHPYKVYLDQNSLEKTFAAKLKSYVNNDILLVVDRNVNRLHGEFIDSALSVFKGRVRKVSLHASESKKSIESVEKIHKVLLHNKFGRDSLLVSVGGGIVGDIAGFAASTYMRGIKYIQVPTTILAAVDSSVGGKTGINFFDTKNVIGTFYQPAAVFIDTIFFKTLPEKEIVCGGGEMLKYALISRPKYYSYFKKNLSYLFSLDEKVVQKLIYESVKIKAGVVEFDEREAGIRKILNFGHTFAHALEIEQNHNIKHGEAVIYGIACALILSDSLNILKPSKREIYFELVRDLMPYVKFNEPDYLKIYRIMAKDKKNRDGKIKFVLLKSIGKVVLDVEAPRKLVMDSLKYSYTLFKK